MKNQQYTFGKLSFSSAKEIKLYCDKLRLSCAPGDIIQGNDNYLLLSAIALSSKRIRNRFRGQPITTWTTKKDTSGGQGIAANLEDGRCISISIKKAIKCYIGLEESEF